MAIDKNYDTDVRESLELLQNFLTYKKFDLDDFKNFDFNDLSNDPKKIYACPNRTFDCDDTQLARAVYILLWREYYDNLKSDNIASNKEFRGDTINTFNTVFGNPPSAIERKSPYHDELYAKYIESKIKFYNKYHTIGNFVILPNNRVVRGNSRSMTINKYRNSCYKDNFSRFFNTVESFYKNKLIDIKTVVSEAKIQRWLTLFSENEFFFNSDKWDFTRFYTTLFLEEYLNKTFVDYPLYSRVRNQRDIKKLKYHYSKAIKYADNSTQIIDSRANKMVDRLTALYPELLAFKHKQATVACET